METNSRHSCYQLLRTARCLSEELVHAHRFRDTFAVELLLAGVPLDRVSLLLGHSSIRIGKVLKDIHIPDDILAQLEKSLLTDKGRDEAIRKQQGERLKQRLSAVRHRLDQAYLDKLDGKISEEFWTRKSAEWMAEEQQVLLAIQGLSQASPDRSIDAVRIFELANKAHFLYVSQPAPEKAKLLRMVLSNCSVDAVNIYPLYKQPFDLIFARAKNEEWRALGDDFRTFLRDSAFASDRLSSVAVPAFRYD